MAKNDNTTPAKTLQDVTNDAYNLHQLIDLATCMMIDASYEELAHETFAKQFSDRMTSLLWVIRDMSDSMRNRLDLLPLMEPVKRYQGGGGEDTAMNPVQRAAA